MQGYISMSMIVSQEPHGVCDKNETPPTDMSLGGSDVELSSTDMKGVMSAE